MSDTKFGLDQTEKPAPLWYRRLSNALIIFIIPGAVGLIQGWGFRPEFANKLLMISAFIPAVIKGIGTLMGNGQYYVPSNQTMDQQKLDSK